MCIHMECEESLLYIFCCFVSRVRAAGHRPIFRLWPSGLLKFCVPKASGHRQLAIHPAHTARRLFHSAAATIDPLPLRGVARLVVSGKALIRTATVHNSTIAATQ